jgi:hypothetical protein
LTVAVEKAGYVINGSPKTAPIYYAPPLPVEFVSLTANGSDTQLTTELTLTFSQAIPDLFLNDYTLSGVSGVRIDSSGPSSLTPNSYTLYISGFTSGGTLAVAVEKAGYAISGPKTVPIYYAPPIPVEFVSLTANGSAARITTELTLAFSQAIPDLHRFDLSFSLNGGIEYPGWTDLTTHDGGLSYTISIYRFTSSGTLTVAVEKAGYVISGSPKTVPIYYVEDHERRGNADYHLGQ